MHGWSLHQARRRPRSPALPALAIAYSSPPHDAYTRAECPCAASSCVHLARCPAQHTKLSTSHSSMLWLSYLCLLLAWAIVHSSPPCDAYTRVECPCAALSCVHLTCCPAKYANFHLNKLHTSLEEAAWPSYICFLPRCIVCWASIC